MIIRVHEIEFAWVKCLICKHLYFGYLYCIRVNVTAIWIYNLHLKNQLQFQYFWILMVFFDFIWLFISFPTWISRKQNFDFFAAFWLTYCIKFSKWCTVYSNKCNLLQNQSYVQLIGMQNNCAKDICVMNVSLRTRLKVLELAKLTNYAYDFSTVA